MPLPCLMLSPQNAICPHASGSLLTSSHDSFEPGLQSVRALLWLCHVLIAACCWCNLFNQSVGIHTVSSLLPDICELAGVARRTNHGMRRTAMHYMMKQGFSLDDIRRRTRHKSVEALLQYLGYACSCLCDSWHGPA